MDTHPYNPPMVYVRPTDTMQIKSGRNVDQNGQVDLPYLREWRYVNIYSMLLDLARYALRAYFLSYAHYTPCQQHILVTDLCHRYRIAYTFLQIDVFMNNCYKYLHKRNVNEIYLLPFLAKLFL